MRVFAIMLAVACCFTSLAKAATKEEIISRGYLQCGVLNGFPGFSTQDENNNWSGFDVDFCRAVAAATLGDAARVKYVALKAKERFIALQSGEVDLLASSTTWTFTRDSSLGLNFAGISYYDGQGFMVLKNSGVVNAFGLNEAAVCVQSRTTSESNLADYFAQTKMVYQAILFDTLEQAFNGFEAKRCTVLTGDQSQLYGLRLKLAHPDDAVILQDVISKEPMGPVVRQGDDAWFNIVKWTLFTMINGEELRVTSGNVDQMKEGGESKVRRFIGLEGMKGEGLGLRDDWSYQIIKQVGNYGEIFERTLGGGSALEVRRGLNRLWVDGGLHYAPPLR